MRSWKAPFLRVILQASIWYNETREKLYMELPREFSLTKKTQTTFCLATEVVYFFGIVSEPICYNEIGYIYDNLYLLQVMFFSRNIESSYVPTIFNIIKS